MTLELDTSRFIAALEHGRTSSVARALELQDRMDAGVDRAAVRWYVRGAIHPMFADPESRDGQVQAMLAERYPARIVVAFIVGWVTHRES